MPVREFTPLAVPETASLSCIEPDYKSRIDPKMIRRMSRIIRMGFYTALESMEEAGQIRPGAIISATGLGCLEDTGLFIEKLINNREEMLSPTAFIQSTHNAVAAQVALSMQNHGYNHTWVQGGISFECAVEDAALWAAEHSGVNRCCLLRQMKLQSTVNRRCNALAWLVVMMEHQGSPPAKVRCRWL